MIVVQTTYDKCQNLFFGLTPSGFPNILKLKYILYYLHAAIHLSVPGGMSSSEAAHLPSLSTGSPRHTGHSRNLAGTVSSRQQDQVIYVSTSFLTFSAFEI